MKFALSKLVAVFFYFFLLGCNKKEEVNCVYLLPNRFEGIVIVSFDDLKGVAEEYEGNDRVYRIPSNGILKTKFPAPEITHHYSFFCLDSMGKRIELPYFTAIDLRENKETSKVICYDLEKAVNKNKKTNRVKKFEILVVSYVDKLDSIANQKSMKMWRVLNE